MGSNTDDYGPEDGLVSDEEYGALPPSSRELIDLAASLRKRIQKNHEEFMESQAAEISETYKMCQLLLDDIYTDDVLDDHEQDPWIEMLSFFFYGAGIKRTARLARAMRLQHKADMAPKGDLLWRRLARW